MEPRLPNSNQSTYNSSQAHPALGWKVPQSPTHDSAGGGGGGNGDGGEGGDGGRGGALSPHCCIEAIENKRCLELCIYSLQFSHLGGVDVRLYLSCHLQWVQHLRSSRQSSCTCAGARPITPVDLSRRVASRARPPELDSHDNRAKPIQETYIASQKQPPVGLKSPQSPTQLGGCAGGFGGEEGAVGGEGSE